MDTQKEKLIEKYRYANVEYFNWWEFIFYDFIEDAAKKGFEVEFEDISFSGFCSQGDGASFTGNVDVEKFLLYHKAGNEFRGILNAMRNFGGGVAIVRNSYGYSHEKTCGLGGDDIYDAIEYYTQEDKDGERRKKLMNDREKVLSWIEDVRLQLCKELYKMLEKEYEYLTSDKAVLESIEANGWE